MGSESKGGKWINGWKVILLELVVVEESGGRGEEIGQGEEEREEDSWERDWKDVFKDSKDVSRDSARDFICTRQ